MNSSAATPRKSPEAGQSLAERRADGTLVDSIQATVRDSVLAGTYKPGQKLSITAIASENSVSLSVVREALTRLAADGLVTFEAMRGFHVLQATAKDLDDLSDMLKMLMAAAVRGAVVNGDRAWEAAVIGAHHLLCRAVEIDHEADLDQAHTDFWIAMASGCDNQRLLTSLASLLRAQALYHRISVRLARSETSSRTEVYGRIVQFAINRDAESAIALILDDIDSATAACRDYLLATAQPVSKRGRKSR